MGWDVKRNFNLNEIFFGEKWIIFKWFVGIINNGKY